MNTPTTNTNKAKDAAEKAITKLADDLASGDSASLTNYLRTMAKFHQYSFGNQLLIALQSPGATRIAGFHTWLKLNRSVRKGEKGIMILAPIVGKRPSKEMPDEVVSAVFGFRAAYVFDIAQTEGAELPVFAETIGDPGDALTGIRAFAERKGFIIAYDATIAPALGMSKRDGNILLMPGLTLAQEFTTLTHEIAHSLLHKSDSRAKTTINTRELEAEAVSFVVANALGLDTNTAAVDYIKLYDGTKEALIASLQNIRSTAMDILADLLTPLAAEEQAA
jgi:antirestriction protein ArdC